MVTSRILFTAKQKCCLLVTVIGYASESTDELPGIRRIIRHAAKRPAWGSARTQHD
jgi:hypothetical protein